MPILLEACVDTLDDAIRAESLGAGRIELCADLGVGGTTPRGDVVAAAIAGCGIPVHPIVRPRGGDFCFTHDEVAAMVRDVARFRALGLPGVVTGALTTQGTIDADAMARLRDAAGDMEFTCHKAFDAVRDQAAALEALIALGVTRVLTSGGAPTAWEGRQALVALVRQAAGRIAVMPGGGIVADHAADLAAMTGASALHLRATDAARFRAVAEVVHGLP